MTRNLRARRGSQSGSPLPAPDCDTRYVDQWPEEWVLVGRGTADSQATALRPGDVVSESGPPASSPSRARRNQCGWSETVAIAG